MNENELKVNESKDENDFQLEAAREAYAEAGYSLD